jgi:hypothetical protein
MGLDLVEGRCGKRARNKRKGEKVRYLKMKQKEHDLKVARNKARIFEKLMECNK